MTQVYLPGDAGALAQGAETVARKLAGAGHSVVRTGSRGLYWLEPMAEIDGPQGRIGFGPLTAEDSSDLNDRHPKHLGLVAAIPELAAQSRLTFGRCGVVDPGSLESYRQANGLAGLTAALQMTPNEVIAAVTQSGLRGRGGAGFPAGIKWRTVADTKASQRYIVCNADEGDSGTFADRMLLEGDPFQLIEGMVIAGYAVGATRGYVYLRSEYPHAARAFQTAIDRAYDGGLLGANLLGRDLRFDLELRIGAGAYICGEETALLESLEGRRGQVRFRPPLPAVKGLFGQPTVVNNVLTLAAVTAVMADGPEAYANLGQGRSRGTQPFQLAGNVKRPGLYELAFGVTLRQLIETLGGGTASGRPIGAVQVGGPLGAYLPPAKLDIAMDYETLAAAGGLLGHGGVVVFDDQVDMAAQARFAMSFCAAESCGKCTPCRIGAVRGVEVIDRIVAGQDRAGNLSLLRDLCETMTDGSLCALGGLTPLPVLSALDHFRDHFAPGPSSRAAE